MSVYFHLERVGRRATFSRENLQRNGGYSVTFNKGYKLFAGVRLNGEKSVLQGPGSDVQLHIPEGLHGFISGHAHTDPAPFLDHIPESECLVSPIVEYNCTLTKRIYNKDFQIKILHCVKNLDQFRYIKVWHGNIYEKVSFFKYHKYKVHDKYLNINTLYFSQFFCTVAGCQERCHGNPKVFVFGRITPLRYPPIKSSLRIYMCSPLYDIADFKRVS